MLHFLHSTLLLTMPLIQRGLMTTYVLTLLRVLLSVQAGAASLFSNTVEHVD